jgi:hypothetical protein
LKEKYERHTKIYTVCSKKEEEVGYAVVWEEQTIKKKIHPTELNIESGTVGDHKRYSTWNKKRTEGDNQGLVEYNEQKTDEKP